MVNNMIPQKQYGVILYSIYRGWHLVLVRHWVSEGLVVSRVLQEPERLG